MINEYYNKKTDPSHYGGLIHHYDYEGSLTMENMASRIAADQRFDQKCKYNTLNRDRQMKKGKVGDSYQ